MDKLSIFLIYHTHQQRPPSRRELSSTSLTALSSLAENLVLETTCTEIFSLVDLSIAKFLNYNGSSPRLYLTRYLMYCYSRLIDQEH